MANTDFGVLIQAELDKNGVKSDLEQIQDIIKNYHLELTPKLQDASLRNQFKSICNEMARDFNRTFNANVSGNDIFKVYENKAKQLEQQVQKVKSIQLKIDTGSYDSKIASLTSKTQQWSAATDKTKISVSNLNKAYENLVNSKTDEEKIQNARLLDAEIKKVEASVQRVNATFAKDSQIASLHQKIQEFYDKNSAAHATYGDSLKKYLKDTEVGAELTQAELDKIATGFNNIKNQARQTGKLGLNLFDSIKTQAAKFGQWFSITSVISTGISEVKKMVDAVYEIDTAMTSLYKVTDETAEKYELFLNSASDSAKELGRSVSSLIEQTADWAKLGYNIDDSATLAKTSSIYANVGEVDDATAVSDIVTAMKAFNITAEDSMSIIDMYNKLGNEFAVSSAGIGEGVKNSASALAMQGNSIQQVVAMLTGGGEITQNVGELGNMLKVASLRLASMKGQLEEIGESYDDIESVSKNQTQIYNFTKGQVNILDEQNGKLKDTYTILEEVAGAWDDVNKLDKNELLELLFGKQRANQGAAILQAFQSGQIQKAYEAANNSAGSAMQEQERWMESLEAKIQRFQAAFQSLSNTVINSDFLKALVDGGTTLLTLLEKLIDNFGVLGTTIAGIGGFKFIKNFDQPKIQGCPSFPISLGMGLSWGRIYHNGDINNSMR